MVVQEKLYTADDLWELSHQVADAKRLELVKGSILEMTPAGGSHGLVTHELGRLIGNYVAAHKLGYVTAAETGFILATNPDIVRAPDVGFVAKVRMPHPIPQKYIPVAPDLAVEVVSPNDAAENIRKKVIQFLDAGTLIVWVVYPEARTVDIYRPGQHIQSVGMDGALDGGEALPGLTIPVGDVFASAD